MDHFKHRFFFSEATLELEDKYQRTVNEIEALKDHLGKVLFSYISAMLCKKRASADRVETVCFM